MSNENPMEDFWGCTLTKGKKEYSWNPIETEEDIEHKLQVTTACLGPKAKDGERNLVEVTTEDEQGKQTTCSIVSLRVGRKECFHLELGFNNPTKFTLREGSGPVSLCGVHLQAEPIDFSDIENEEDSDISGDEDIPKLVEIKNTKKEVKPVENKKTETSAKKAGKRPLEDDKKDKQVSKKMKPEPESEEDEEDEEESGEENEGEESEDEEMPSLLDGEAEEDDDEESEDEDEPEQGDSLDDEDDEEEDDDDDEEDKDEDSEDDEEEEDETPVKPQKKPLTNGHTPKNKKEQQQKTPANKITKTPQKTPAKKTPEEIKAMLIKSPNLPKKFDKFENYMKNNMKVTDKKTLKDFWDYVEKNRK